MCAWEREWVYVLLFPIQKKINDAVIHGGPGLRQYEIAQDAAILYCRVRARLQMRKNQGGREVELETGFLFGCVLYRMLCSVQFLPRWSMQFCTVFAILDNDPRTKLEWRISSPFLPGLVLRCLWCLIHAAYFYFFLFMRLILPLFFLFTWAHMLGMLIPMIVMHSW